jgi:hypothetical protein
LWLDEKRGSRHLDCQKRSGSAFAAQTIYYRLDDDAATRVIDLLCDIYGGKPNR